LGVCHVSCVLLHFYVHTKCTYGAKGGHPAGALAKLSKLGFNRTQAPSLPSLPANASFLSQHFVSCAAYVFPR
jgi:hypothetical protein